MQLKLFNNWLFKKAKRISVGEVNTSFTDLTPVDNADPDRSYARALSFALKNPRIKNIAITGPYGSGKSSIIRTYEKFNNFNFLNISLASFKEDNTNSINATLVERSILQQMLYGADANKLPYSRFKRISTPEQPLFKSLLIAIWPIAAIFLYYFRNELLNIESYSLLWFGEILLIAFIISLPVTLISDIYKTSFGLSLKKLSLKNAEIETGELSEKSILNRHLDEIIYFFQATKYDVVVIEDLDRFGDPEIFVKLREINKLINDNEKTREIKFLYALKDDMFAHKNRAKFFDFIIPVVPIINSSNSLDKMQERLRKHDFALSIDTQFLREVSFYIDDLRLIHNIFNELVIYYERLKSESLDLTKLLAMMVYKNVYPNDFEKLHYGQGALFEICNKRSEYILRSKNHLNEQKEDIRTLIGLADTEEVRSIRELIDVYIGHIVTDDNTPQEICGLVNNNQYLRFSQLRTFEQFEPILTQTNIQIATNTQNHPHYRRSINKSFAQVEEEINPGETFLSRKENIENNTKSRKIELQKDIRRIEKEIDKQSQLQIYQILQKNDIEFDELISRHEIIDGGRLLKYLVKNGYLDDNYYLYTSNFHEGRLTKNDHDFLLTIRNFNRPDPDQKIDTPNEVCAAMRMDDFGHNYVLNVTLIDYLLSNSEINIACINSALRYITQNFGQCEEFFAAYFVTGKYLDKFIRSLSMAWPEFAAAAISSKHGSELVSYILRFVDAEYVSKDMDVGKILTAYLSEQGHLVFASDLQLPDNYNVLKKMNVRFHDLGALSNNKALLEFVHTECLYTITSTNVNYILQNYSNPQNINTIDPERANYTSILDAGSENFKNYVKENLKVYVEMVFLALPNNSKESETAIKSIINNDLIEYELNEKIISKQDFIFDTFDGIPENLWSYLLMEEKITISWVNITEYFKSFDSDVVTELLGRQKVVDTLSKHKITEKELGEEESKSLCKYILNNNVINDTDYCKLINLFPYYYRTFPEEISEEKLNCLTLNRKVRLSEESFSFAEYDNHLVAKLISMNFEEYLEKKEDYTISDDVRELLLSSEINNEKKLIICRDITPSSAVESKSLSSLIANVLVLKEVDCSNIDNTILSSAILNAQTLSESIQLFIKCLPNWDESITMKVLADLPEPYAEVAKYGKHPKLENNNLNLEFSRFLKQKGFISSFKEGSHTIKINTFKSSDHSKEISM